LFCYSCLFEPFLPPLPFTPTLNFPGFLPFPLFSPIQSKKNQPRLPLFFPAARHLFLSIASDPCVKLCLSLFVRVPATGRGGKYHGMSLIGLSPPPPPLPPFFFCFCFDFPWFHFSPLHLWTEFDTYYPPRRFGFCYVLPNRFSFPFFLNPLFSHSCFPFPVPSFFFCVPIGQWLSTPPVPILG